MARLEWYKQTARDAWLPTKGGLEFVDQSHIPAKFEFRFHNEEVEDLFNELSAVVACYKGSVVWLVKNRPRQEALRGINGLLLPERLWDITPKAADLGEIPQLYLARVDPEFGRLTHEDAIGLAEHIARHFRRDSSN
ncbi:hypothetical protein ACILG0_24075 [Pseudomonadota bacterium AL_CKDN230030165-1A_HGKHYDSX7]